MVTAELAGPPSNVRMNAWSKTWNELMMAMMKTKNVVGERSGSVMYQNLWNLFAPSIFAASMYVAGMTCNPARKMTMQNPIASHMLMIAIEGITHLGSSSH